MVGDDHTYPGVAYCHTSCPSLTAYTLLSCQAMAVEAGCNSGLRYALPATHQLLLNFKMQDKLCFTDACTPNGY